MTLPIAFRWEAVAELEEAVGWYEERSPGLGKRFKIQVEAAIDRIRQSPEAFGRVYGDIRYARVRRFPYGVFYRIESEQILVLAVFHAKRDPGVWQARSWSST